MPDMDGYEFVEIKSHPDTVFIPLFFVTAISNEQNICLKPMI
jgi:response regulator RpfG family c-di-GMP phosphodiesterase